MDFKINDSVDILFLIENYIFFNYERPSYMLNYENSMI